MRLLLLAFALGILALQQQSALPRAADAIYLAIPLTVAFLLTLGAGFVSGWRRQAAQAIGWVAAAMALGILGFFFAAWRAESRLADELPPAWEGRDIAIAGVIDELPQPADRGIRFAFDVERVLTPDAVVPSRLSLAWYEDSRRDTAAESVPKLHAGERWNLTVRLKRPHGTVNPQASMSRRGCWKTSSARRGTCARTTPITGSTPLPVARRTTSRLRANRSAAGF